MDAQADLPAQFLAEVEAAIKRHNRAYTKDTALYQLIVIASDVCGIVSLFAGAMGQSVLAGVMGAQRQLRLS